MKEIIKERTKKLGTAIINLIDDFPNNPRPGLLQNKSQRVPLR